jgi:hypothetical protein
LPQAFHTRPKPAEGAGGAGLRVRGPSLSCEWDKMVAEVREAPVSLAFSFSLFLFLSRFSLSLSLSLSLH